jgi:hypothetical protein
MKRIDWSAAKAVYVNDPTFTLRRRFMWSFTGACRARGSY